MKRYLLLVFLLVVVPFLSSAQDSEMPWVRPVCGPYLQNVTQNSFTVIWTTDMDALSWVEVAPDD
ncbi:MAG: serine/threonine protein phosphatase, partial [Bacteroidales bacterium]|nr:serine/threonine protein phosphatase [Bacteroidales bacterium]